jgi:16S rRNA (cytosine1402-N4)-methyltransferase
MTAEHLPVMLREALELLELQKGGIYVDATVGPGGHSEALLSHLDSDSRLICLDRDEETLHLAKKRLGSDKRTSFAHSRFSDIRDVLKDMGVQGVDGILMDFGVSMLQLKTPERGFSFMTDDALDMRMDRSEPLTAGEAVNTWSEFEIARVIYEYGGERRSRRIAASICRARRKSRIETGTQLASIVISAIGRGGGKSHPATRTFQGLRIAVNREMEEIDDGLVAAISSLTSGGRLVTIAYHSLEDGKVKRFFRERGREGLINVITKKPLVPTRDEVRANPSARSAKMRAAEAV